jgi:hypothetical protein
MKLHLDFQIPESNLKISHNDSLLFLGSCFSDEMGNESKKHGFQSVSNPMGTFFHPLVIAQFILDCIKEPTKERVFKREDVCLSWDAGAYVYGMTVEQLIAKKRAIRNSFLKSLKSAKVMFITFGSAYGYRLREDNKFVANCHKMPQSIFNKEFTKIEEMELVWSKIIDLLKEINSDLSLVFTVSPVRHIKDGLIENNRSKARLIEVVSRLVEKGSCTYFPSYEMIMDDLRDYRFYGADLVHPNQTAITYVWEGFSKVFLTKDSIDLAIKVRRLKERHAHQLIHPESNASCIMQEKLESEVLSLKKMYPKIQW